MLIILFLVSHCNFLFVPCGRLSWLPVSFLLHVKYPLSYRIVSYVGPNDDELSETPSRDHRINLGHAYANVELFYVRDFNHYPHLLRSTSRDRIFLLHFTDRR